MIETYKKDVFEILRKLNNLETAAERREAIVNLGEAQPIINDILAIQFNDCIREYIDFPDTPPPYTEAPDGQSATNLRKEYKKFSNFISHPGNRLPALRRETMFIQMLEGLNHEDAKIVANLFTTGEWEFRGINKLLVKKALPKLLDTPTWYKPRKGASNI